MNKNMTKKLSMKVTVEVFRFFEGRRFVVSLSLLFSGVRGSHAGVSRDMGINRIGESVQKLRPEKTQQKKNRQNRRQCLGAHHSGPSAFIVAKTCIELGRCAGCAEPLQLGRRLGRRAAPLRTTIPPSSALWPCCIRKAAGAHGVRARGRQGRGRQ